MFYCFLEKPGVYYGNEGEREKGRDMRGGAYGGGIGPWLRRLPWLAAVAAYLLLAAYLVFTSSWGRREADDARVRLVLAVPTGVALTPIFRETATEFERDHPDIAIDLLEVGGQFYRKVTVMIAGGSPPDLMWMGQSFVEFADRDAFLDVTDRVTGDAADRVDDRVVTAAAQAPPIDLAAYPEDILALYRKDGRYYGVPYGIDASFLVYNRRHFREAGLDDPADDWDFDAFLAAARRLVRRDADGRVMRFALNAKLPYELFGARVFDPATGLADCDTPEMVEYFKTNRRLAEDERVIPDVADAAAMGADLLALFRQEKVSMLLGFTMRWNRMFDQFAGMDWGVALLPKVKRQAQWGSSQAICISRATRHPDAAWEFCRYLQGPEFQARIARQCLPANKASARAFIESASGRAHNFVVMEKVLGLLEPLPRVANLQELMSVFSGYSHEAFYGLLTPEEAMRRCAAEINRRRRKKSGDGPPGGGPA